MRPRADASEERALAEILRDKGYLYTPELNANGGLPGILRGGTHEQRVRQAGAAGERDRRRGLLLHAGLVQRLEDTPEPGHLYKSRLYNKTDIEEGFLAQISGKRPYFPRFFLICTGKRTPKPISMYKRDLYILSITAFAENPPETHSGVQTRFYSSYVLPHLRKNRPGARPVADAAAKCASQGNFSDTSEGRTAWNKVFPQMWQGPARDTGKAWRDTGKAGIIENYISEK